MDTSTVNYALDRIEAAYYAAMPQIQNVGEKLVHYHIDQIVSMLFAELVFILIIAISTIACFCVAKKTKNEDINNIACMLTFFFLIGLFLALFLPFGEIRDLYMCTRNPEIYTVNKIIEKF